MWFERADCDIHFCTRRASQRGASLKIPFEAVEKLNCQYLIDRCIADWETERAPIYQIYIPAPSDLARKEAFNYHLTTRNVFAYAVGTPLVGEKLSTALIDLCNRLQEWEAFSLPDFSDYLEKQGYSRYGQNPEHALAGLKFAEDARLKDMWVDAFVHCVGMRERLDLSPEYSGISHTTQALITRASLEMDLHIQRVIRAVGGFLEEELGAENLGLSKAARDHLDHFRSFLHAFYVDKFGYFPPSEDIKRWSKRPWAGMYQDFQNLYEYLVDDQSSYDLTNTRELTGGVCVVQNVEAFNERHGYEALPHPLPLLPQVPTLKRRSLSSQRALRGFKLGRYGSLPQPKLTPNQALAVATNAQKEEVMECSLVLEYQRFERQKCEIKLDLAEARKVRWLLIYSVLQMLKSIIKAPQEVRDTETTYPICVLIKGGSPAWAYEESISEQSESEASERSIQFMIVPEALDALEGRTSRISIHPDCEADSADDFFAMNCAGPNGITRHASLIGLNLPPSPTRPSRAASLRSSMHSSVQALQKSVAGSLGRGNSIRRASMSLLPLQPRKKPSWCDKIVVEDYDNEIDEELELRPDTAVYCEETPRAEVSNPLHGFNFDFAVSNDEPTLDYQQLTDHLNLTVDESHAISASPCDSYFSAASPGLTDSNRSSYVDDDDDDASPGTELSSVDGDGYKHDSYASAESIVFCTLKDPQPQMRPKALTYRPSQQSLGVKSACFSVSAGCYVPTGMVSASPITITKHEHFRHESLTSIASSMYPDSPLQADDIEEEDTRGRRRSRWLDDLAYSGASSRKTLCA